MNFLSLEQDEKTTAPTLSNPKDDCDVLRICFDFKFGQKKYAIPYYTRIVQVVHRIVENVWDSEFSYYFLLKFLLLCIPFGHAEDINGCS